MEWFWFIQNYNIIVKTNSRIFLHSEKISLSTDLFFISTHVPSYLQAISRLPWALLNSPDISYKCSNIIDVLCLVSFIYVACFQGSSILY